MPPKTSNYHTYLWCIVINDQLQVLIKPFQLVVPQMIECDIIFPHLRIAVPSLRSLNSTYTLHTPHPGIHIRSSEPIQNLSETQVDLDTPVGRQITVENRFPDVDTNEIGDINAIICLRNLNGTVQFYQANQHLTLSQTQR